MRKKSLQTTVLVQKLYSKILDYWTNINKTDPIIK